LDVRITVVLIAIACSGCYLGLSGGAYQIQEPTGDTRQAWSLGVTAGYYIVYGETRLSVGRGMEVSAPTEGPATSYGSGMWTARLDRSVAARLRLTGIAGMNNDVWVMPRGGDERIDYPTGKHRFLFGGPTLHYRNFMVSAGPAYLRWATNEMGTATSIGGQIRITASFNIYELGEIMASQGSIFSGDGECGRWCQAIRYEASKPERKPKPRASREGTHCTQTYRDDATHGTTTTYTVCY
jgi:hypothetical protein